MQQATGKPGESAGQPALPANAALDRAGRVFYKNPLDAPRGISALDGKANAEFLMTDFTYGSLFAEKAYKDLKTPLKDYCRGLADFDLAEHLQDLVDSAWKAGGKARILDVGVGEGSQWLAFLNRNEGRLEFSAVALTNAYSHPNLLPYLVTCEAAGMAHEFPQGHFDAIVSHSGMHQQGLAGLKAIEYLLRAGGEAFVAMSAKTAPDIDEIAAECPALKIERAASETLTKAVYYHFRKI
jgi:hypothetical protein